MIDVHVAANPVMASVTHMGQSRPAPVSTNAEECPAALIRIQGVQGVDVRATVANEAEAAAAEAAIIGCVGSGSRFDEAAPLTTQDQSLPGVFAPNQEPSAQPLPLGDVRVASDAVDGALAECYSVVNGVCADDARTPQDGLRLTRVVQSNPLVIAAAVIKILAGAGLLPGT